MILVTGATGNVGGELVRALAGAGQPVRALTRNDRPREWPPGVQQAAGDLNKPESMAAALAGATAMFLYPGYQDMAGTLAAARLTERAVAEFEQAIADWLQTVGGQVRMAEGRIQSISLARVAFDDSQLKHLEKLTGLEKLNLDGTDVSDLGLERGTDVGGHELRVFRAVPAGRHSSSRVLM
jgi:NAD(P)-dependent dehydrogenase (short-subunit alcohol dehydrogenase family)